MFNRIRLAIAIVKTGASFIFNVKTSLIIPFFTGTLIAGSIAIYLVGFIFNLSCGTIIPNGYGVATVTLS
jgi:hypothetical protein